MLSFVSPVVPLHFDTEGYSLQSAWSHRPNFPPIWANTDIVNIQIREPNLAFNPLLGMRLIAYGVDSFDPNPIRPFTPGTFNVNPPSAVNYAIDLSSFLGWTRFEYFNIGDLGRYYTPTYLVTDDECLLKKTILISYWNDDALLGGNNYPDVDYTNFKHSIRVFASLDYDGSQDRRTFVTDGVGLSRLCVAERQPIFRLVVGPQPQWLHEILRYVFTHQHVEIQRYGENDVVSLVPFSEYEIESQVGTRFDDWIGSGRLIVEERGVLTC